MKPIRSLLPLLLTGAVAFTATACTLLTTAAWFGVNPPPASGVGAERLREIQADKEAAAWAARDTATRETAP